MSLQKSMTITKDMKFEKCGEIMVAAEHNIFALSCKYCGQKFTQFQGFMRHLQLKHSDQVKFGEKQKNVEIYAVEELLTTLNQSSMPEEGEENEEDEGGDNQSEESGMVEDEANWLSEEDKTWLEEADTDRVEQKKDEKKKGKSLMANMSILKALEDCDVSFNAMDNLDVTKCEEDKENSDDEMEEEYDLNKTLLQQIQDDWGSSVEEENPNKSKGAKNQDDKLGEEEEDPNKSKGSNNQDDKLGKEVENPNKSKCSNNEDEELDDCSFMTSTQNEENLISKSAGLKSLLEGLEDLDDVDSLLENLEESMIVEQNENKKTTLLNSKIENKSFDNFVQPTNKLIKNSKTPVLEDLDLTLNHQPDEKETVVNYNLAVKDGKGSDTRKFNEKSSNNRQQKMILNIKTGEFELVDADESLKEEELINKSIKTVKDEKGSENVTNNEKSTKNREEKMILNIKTGEFELVDADADESLKEEEIFNKSIKTSQTVKDEKGLENGTNNEKSTKNREQKMILNIKTGEFELVDAEDSSEEEEIFNKSIETSQDNDNTRIDENLNDTLMAQLESQLNEQIESDEKSLHEDDETEQQSDFDLKLKNLELSLDVDNHDNFEIPKNKQENLLEREDIKSQDSLEEDTLIDNKLINKSDKAETEMTDKSKDLMITTKENKKNNLNDDLTKALEDALGEDDLNMLNMYDEEENEPPLNQNLKDLLALELMEEEDEIVTEEKSKDTTINSKLKENIAIDKADNFKRSPKLEKFENVRVDSNNFNKIIEANTKDNDIKIANEPLEDTSKLASSRYEKTNIKSRKKQELKYSISKNKVTLKSRNNINFQINPQKTENYAINSHNVLQLKNPKSTNDKAIKRNNDMKDTISKDIFKPKTPNKSQENQENLVINKENRENIFSKLRKTPKKLNQENITPDLIRKIKPEKFTPFINTERGDRTPLQADDIFLKKSPKSQGKLNDFLENITPNQGAETSPNSRERQFLKQSPKTQEKNGQQLHPKTPTTRGNKTPTIRKHIVMKETPKTREKNEEQTNSKYAKTPRKTPVKTSPKTQEKNEEQTNSKFSKTPLKGSPKTQEKNEEQTSSKLEKIPVKGSPKTQEKNEETQTNSKLAKTPGKRPYPQQISPIQENNTKFGKTSPSSPKKHSKEPENLKKCITTPQRIRNVAVKLPTPVKLKEANLNTSKSPTNISPLIQQKIDNFLKPTQSETTTNLVDNIKMPKAITMKKISPMKIHKGIRMKQISPMKIQKNAHNQSVLDETPIKPIYSKQNFSESSLQDVKQTGPSHINKLTTLIQPQQRSSNSLQKLSNSKLRERRASIDIVNKINGTTAKTSPKHNNLDYKSYSLNRSTRKKEVLQRMRHIKKQIFKSVENGGEQVTEMRNRKLKKSIQINNIQILPKLREEQMTPLLNTSDDTTPTPPTVISPKNLNDDEKQAKKSLHCSTSPINDDEKLRKKSLKRQASSPLLCEEQQAKRLHTSPSVSVNDVETKSKDLEKTQLDPSERVVDCLQRDLKANINDDDEELPNDDNSPNETSIESNGNEKKIEDADIDNCKNNILDDLLEQVDTEQKSGVNNYPIKKDPEGNTTTTDTCMDFDENKDLNILNNFGLKIIKLPNIEDISTVEEIQEMHEKAQTFAEIYRTWQRIWCSKNGESSNLRQELDFSFKQFLTQINQIFNLEMNMIDIRRLVNLISMWYVQIYNGKLMDKKQIPDATGQYLTIFNYIPKAAKRFYYCEFCEEHFNTGNKYQTHRILHTGAAYPYQCSTCSEGFKIEKKYRTHEQQCNAVVSEPAQNNSSKKDVEEEMNHIIKSKSNGIENQYTNKNEDINVNKTPENEAATVVSEPAQNNSSKKDVEQSISHILKSNNIRITKLDNKSNGNGNPYTTKNDDINLNKTPENPTTFKCNVCKLDFETSKELFDHSKTHIKSIYNCVKCQVKFSTVSEVQHHMSICNRNVKKLPKQTTPRPQRSKVETNPTK